MQVPRAIMELFQSADIVALAEELDVRIPCYSLQPFVQRKMFKARPADRCGAAYRVPFCQTAFLAADC